MARPEKEQTVEKLTDILKRATGVVVSDFTGLSVAEMTELRRRCRESKVTYLVVKNTLARFAATRAELEDLIPYLMGPNGFTFGFGDPLVPAKVISGYASELEKLKIRAGVFEGGVIAGEDVKRIAVLPSREALISRVLTQLEAPVSRFAFVLRSMLERFVYTLTQIADGKAAGRFESAGPEEGASPSGEVESGPEGISDELDEPEKDKPQD